MKCLYMKNSLMNKIYLNKKLFSLKMSEVIKVIDHLNAFNTLICQLRGTDVKLNDQDKAITLMSSLIESWDHFVTSLSFNPTYTFEFSFIFGGLLYEEVRRKSSIEISAPKAMVDICQSKEKGENSRVASIKTSKGKKRKLRC